MPVLMPRSRASRDEDRMVAAFVAYAAMASGRPRRLGSCCCSIEANAQLRSTTSVVGAAVLRPSSTAIKCSHVCRPLGEIGPTPLRWRVVASVDYEIDGPVAIVAIDRPEV